MRTRGRLVAAGAGLLAGIAAVTAGAVEPCGICDDKIVTNSVLAQCFLDEYPFLAGKADGAIVVDLSRCEADRGIVPPLAAPGEEVLEPSVTFMVTRQQLDCLKTKLEQEGIDLDPSATIELGSCR